MDAKRKEIALFRYRLIAPLVREARPIPGELTRRAREIAACKYDFPYSERHAVSVDTLLNWVNRYRNAGFDGLVPRLPRPRKDRGQYRVITAQIADQIERLKREDPHRTGARLLRELALSSGKDQPPVSAATLYRFLKQRGLTAQKLLTGASFQPRRNRSHINFIWDEEREVLTKWRRSKDKNLWQKVTALENENLPAKRKAIALFRFGLIAPLVLEARLSRGEFAWRARQIAARNYDFPYSKRTSVSVETLLEWVHRYCHGGFDGLVPKPRGQHSVITAQIADQIERLKREDPRRSGAALLRELALSSGQDSLAISPSTVYRFLKQHGLTTQKLVTGTELDPRRSRWRIKFISDEDRKILTKWRRSKDKNLWQKAVTVLDNANLPPEEIAKKVERPLDCIRSWIKAFNSHGIEALNRPRKPRAPGKRAATFEQKRKRILEILHASPRSHEINRSNWNHSSLAMAYRRQYEEAMSTSTVARIIRKSGYTMKKARKVLCSPDPEYREKVDLVLRTLQNLTPGELFFFVDELGPLRVKRYGGRAFVPKTQTCVVPQNQEDRGSITLAGALNAATNQVTWMYGHSKDTSIMIKLIELLFNQHRSASTLPGMQRPGIDPTPYWNGSIPSTMRQRIRKKGPLFISFLCRDHHSS